MATLAKEVETVVGDHVPVVLDHPVVYFRHSLIETVTGDNHLRGVFYPDFDPRLCPVWPDSQQKLQAAAMSCVGQWPQPFWEPV